MVISPLMVSRTLGVLPILVTDRPCGVCGALVEEDCVTWKADAAGCCAVPRFRLEREEMSDSKKWLDEQDAVKSYADAPKSFLEARSEKLSDSSIWTPRDALISVLRKLDAGEAVPRELIVVWTEEHEGKTFNVNSVIACPTTLASVGLLTVAVHDLLKGGNT